MKPNLIVSIAFLASGLWSFPAEAIAQQALVIKPLAEKKVAELPAGTLFWRIENFPAIAEARAAGGAWSLVAESAGKIWLFTLGPAGGATQAEPRSRKWDRSVASRHQSIFFRSTKPPVLGEA